MTCRCSAPCRRGRERRLPLLACRRTVTMRIAFVTETYPPEVNGVALTVARIVAHLRGAGHDVDLIRPRQAGERTGVSQAHAGREWLSSGWPIPVYRDMRFGLARPRTLAQRLRAADVQLVHVATEGPLGWAAVSAARRLGLPTSSDFRTNFHRYCEYYRLGVVAPLVNAYLRRFHNRTDCTFAPTRQLRRELMADGYRHVEVIGRGVDSDRFSPCRREESLRAGWGVAPGDPVLLYVGRLAAEKNVTLAIEAFRHAQRLRPGARLLIVGDGPLRKRLQSANPDVLFTGTLRDSALAAHYASADIFLFPSLTETFGNVTLEAIASGLPVVAFDVAAAAEHVRDGISGALAPPPAPSAFVDAACRVVALHGTDASMGAQARIAALSADWHTILRRFERRLVDLVESHERFEQKPARLPGLT